MYLPACHAFTERYYVRLFLLCAMLISACPTLLLAEYSYSMSNAESGEDTDNASYDIQWIIHHDLGIIRYLMLTSFQWPFSKICCESGGLISFLQEYHEQFTKSREIGNHFLYHFEITRFPEEIWRDYASTRDREKLSQRYPHDLYLYNGTVWTQRTAQYPDEKQYLARSDTNNSTPRLFVDISVEPNSVQIGKVTTVAISITNTDGTPVYVPLFQYVPIQLVAVRDTDETIAKIDYQGISRLDFTSIGMYLGPQEVRKREFILRIYPEGKQIRDDDLFSQSVAVMHLTEGQYTLTVFDLARFGYPTVCNPARVSVVSGP